MIGSNEDLDLFIRDFGVDCSIAAQPFRALLDRPSEVVAYGGPGGRSTAYLLTLRTDVGQRLGLLDELGDAVDGLVVVVDGDEYTARDGGTYDDGAFAGVNLTRTNYGR